ncbi:hypothetical protein FRC15_007546 [Serendipita sp. 397]|nr:hypothetical protein FRC15_007546 [Serendipita sp. 397]
MQSDLGRRKGLLFTAKDIQDGGDHELKTSPLATWDVIDSGAVDFAQRGLLGEVLSVHADDLPKHTKDSRLYMNLDAPSSGLVCGVQGSGKSYTVSCIMESALMNDPRVGSLPAPLATVVFHYDQEISNRPCEAAFLSESKDGTMRGVEEVVVLVSPKNQEQRKEVYSHLKHVRVEPLKLAEGDLNAKRMLSMMGWDDQETMPLYLQSALAILRDMGSNFTYGGFLHQLRQRIFNMSQSSMLQMRLGLLDSFLHGGGQDISSYFGPGKLLIIDLSDRFVDGKTASMLFDICLGLFMEWKAPTGKLIGETLPLVSRYNA